MELLLEDTSAPGVGRGHKLQLADGNYLQHPIIPCHPPPPTYIMCWQPQCEA